MKLVFKSPPEGHFFFGYFDKSPLDHTCSRLLALKVHFIDRLPNRHDIATIGFFDLSKGGEFIELAETKAFNWQQGCMLQWLGPDFASRIIFNDLDDGRLVSRIIDIESVNVRTVSSPVYSVCANGLHALTIDFERHHFWRRGYSYDGEFCASKAAPLVDGDGIWSICLDTGNKKRVIDLEDLLSIRPLSNMDGAIHYVEHLLINPSGNRFCFLHRWKMRDGGIYARLYAADLDGRNLRLLNDSGRCSHFCWRNDTELLMYGGIPNSLNSLRKRKLLVKLLFKPLLPLYHSVVSHSSKVAKKLTGDGYMLLADSAVGYPESVAEDIRSEDGHPSFLRGQTSVFVTDTYSDMPRNVKAKLMLYDLDNSAVLETLEFDSIARLDHTPMRCDLHPKVDYSGRFLSVDTLNDGVRSIYLYEINLDALG